MPDYSVRALVVDDSFTMTSIIAGFLTSIGFASVDRALDGSSALAMMRARPFGIVISDYVMSPMSGPELRMEMDRTEDLREIPFLLMTAQPPTWPLITLYPDLTDFALKPFSAEALKEKVDALLVAKGRRDALGPVDEVDAQIT